MADQKSVMNEFSKWKDSLEKFLMQTKILQKYCYLTDIILMIRRKNHNKQAQILKSNFGLEHQEKPSKSNKFNYQTNAFSLDGQSAISPTFVGSKQSSPNKYNTKNKSNSAIKRKNESMLRKAYFYEQNYLQQDHDFIPSRTNNYQLQRSLENMLSNKDESLLESQRSPLKQRTINQLSQIKKPSKQSQLQTARKLEHVSFRQKKELMRTNRNNLIQNNQALDQQQLEVKYQELWNYNQNMKKNSFQLQTITSQNGENKLFSQHKHQNLIMNTRPKFFGLAQREKQVRKYSIIKSERNTGKNSQLQKRNTTAEAVKERGYQENCKNKNTSPNIRSKFSSQVEVPERKLSRNYQQLELHSPKNLKIALNEGKVAQNNDLKLKIVQDFSSKISLRIKQLKISMQEMRINKK